MKEVRGSIFNYAYTIQEVDLDVFGHMNNAMYLRLFEQARWQCIEERGFGLNKITELQEGPVLLEITLRFKKELLPRIEVNVTTQLKTMSERFAKLNQQIVGKDGTLYCDADFIVGYWSMTKRKLMPAPKEWLAAMGAPT